MNSYLKIFVLAFFVLAIACSSPTKESSVEESTEEATPEVVEVVEEAAAVDPELGAKVYNQFCIVCHMKNGEGVEGLNPPLVNSEWVNGDKTTLIKLVLNGSEGGNYPVNGETYGNAMTSHSFLTDEEIASVLTHVRSNFENSSDAVTIEEVATVRAENK